MDQIQLQWLIKEGDKLFEKVNNESFFLFEKSMYEMWLDRALDFVGRGKIGATNPLKIYRPEMWPNRSSSKPQVHYGGNITVVYSSDTPRQKPAYSVMDFSDLFERQINFLRELEKDKTEKTISLEQSGLIKNSINKREYQYDPKDKVFKMIKLLADKRNYVKTSLIKSKAGFESDVAVSNAKRSINNILLKNIEIRDFILEGKRKVGYKINPEYFS